MKTDQLSALDGAQTDLEQNIPFEERLFSINATTVILDCSRATVYREIQIGSLEAKEFGFGKRKQKKITGASIKRRIKLAPTWRPESRAA